MKEEMVKVLELKKSLYCSLCDHSKLQFIDIEANTITYNNEFCFGLLKNYSKYLVWKNLKLTNYLHNLFQYLKCFQTDGKGSSFPYEFFGKEHVKLSKLLKPCEEITTPEQASACSSVCQEFDIVGFSKFFDGEREFIERMYDFTLSIIRMFGFTFKKKIEQKADEKVRILAETEPVKNVVSRKHMIDNNMTYFDDKERYESIKETLRENGAGDTFFGRALEEVAETEKPDADEVIKTGDDLKSPPDGGKTGTAASLGLDEPPNTNIKMVKHLLKSIGSISSPTRPEFESYNEISDPKPGYTVMEPPIDISKFATIFNDEGINPLEIKLNFDPGIAPALYMGKVEQRPEKWSAQAIRDYVSASEGDVEEFNLDSVAIQIEPKIPGADEEEVAVEDEILEGEDRELKGKAKKHKHKKRRSERRLTDNHKRKVKRETSNTIKKFLVHLLF